MSDIAALRFEEEGDLVLAHLTGELDVSLAPRFGDEIFAAVPISARGAVLDLTALQFIDSSGVSMLFGLVRKLASRRQALALAAPPDSPVTRVLELVDFPKAAPLAGDVEGAAAALR